MAFKMKNPFKQGFILTPRVNLSANLGLGGEPMNRTISATNEKDCAAKGGCWTASKRETSYLKGEEGFIPDKLQKGVSRPKVTTGTCIECQKA